MPCKSTTETAWISVAESVGSALGLDGGDGEKGQKRYCAYGVDPKARKENHEPAPNSSKRRPGRTFGPESQVELQRKVPVRRSRRKARGRSR